MSEREKLVLDVEVEQGNAKLKLNELEGDFDKLKEKTSDGPEIEQMINADINRAISSIEILRERIQKAEKASGDQKQTITTEIIEGPRRPHRLDRP